MAEVANTVTDIVNPQWEIFEPDQMDLSTVEYEMVEYKDLNVQITDTNTRYEIETRDRDAFLKVHDGYLNVQCIGKQTDGTTALAATDVIAMQNGGQSLFKDCMYLLEDQQIEELRYPGVAWQMKNLADFSKQYGESIGSNEHFYLDTADSGVVMPFENNKVRFFNNTGVRAGVELFVSSDGTRILETRPTDPALWVAGDSVIARVQTQTGIYNVSFYSAATYAGATTGAGVLRSLTIEANGYIHLSLGGGANDDDYVRGFYTENAVVKNVTFFAGSQYIQLRRNGDGAAIRPIDFVGIGDTIGESIIGKNQSLLPTSYNEGFYKRYLQMIKSAGNNASLNYINMWIPLKHLFMFCRAYNKVTRGLRHRFVFNKEDSNQILLRSAATPDRFLSIKNISVWIPRLKPSLSTLRSIESSLSSGAMNTFNFTDLTCWRSLNITQSAGTQQSVLLSTTTKKIIRVWVAFQTAARVEGGQATNKRVFDNLGTTAIQVRLNGRIYPLYEYKFKYEENEWREYNRAYTAFMNSGYKMHDEVDGSLVTLETYKSLYPIFYFDLTCQEEDLYTSNKISELEIRYTNNSAANYYMYVLYESERMLKFQGVNGSLAVQL